MSGRKVDFSDIEWEISETGARSKVFENEDKRIRLVELPKNLKHPEWCGTGHVGYVIQGELEIFFEHGSENYSTGDAFFIRSGHQEKHIPKPLSEMVTLLLVEDK